MTAIKLNLFLRYVRWYLFGLPSVAQPLFRKLREMQNIYIFAFLMFLEENKNNILLFSDFTSQV